MEEPRASSLPSQTPRYRVPRLSSTSPRSSTGLAAPGLRLALRGHAAAFGAGAVCRCSRVRADRLDEHRPFGERRWAGSRAAGGRTRAFRADRKRSGACGCLGSRLANVELGEEPPRPGQKSSRSALGALREELDRQPRRHAAHSSDSGRSATRARRGHADRRLYDTAVRTFNRADNALGPRLDALADRRLPSARATIPRPPRSGSRRPPPWSG